jgi:hypothetical protein
MTLLAAHSTGSLSFPSLIHENKNYNNHNDDDTNSSSAIADAEKKKTNPTRGVVACMKYVGAPLSREQAEEKLNHCPRFKQLVLESQGMNLPSSSSNATTAAAVSSSSSWSSIFLRQQQQTTACDGQDGLDIVERAVMLDYGTRLRACLLEEKKVKHSTPY